MHQGALQFASGMQAPCLKRVTQLLHSATTSKLKQRYRAWTATVNGCATKKYSWVAGGVDSVPQLLSRKLVANHGTEWCLEKIQYLTTEPDGQAIEV